MGALGETPVDGSRIPDFIIVGERRSGSTFLSHCLRRHPGVWMHPSPDYDYFYDDRLASLRPSKCVDSDEEWLRHHDPEQYRALFAEASPEQRTGHKGANLMFWRPAHARMRAFAPDARLLVVLRDPVERAWSQYWNEYGKGRELLGFDEALGKGAERSKSFWHRMNLCYVERGMYACNLQHLMQSFPASSVHVCILEQLMSSPDCELTRVLNFLGVGEPGRDLLQSANRNSNWTLLRRPWVDKPAFRSMEAAYSRFANRLSRAMAGDRYRSRILAATLQKPFRFPATNVSMPDSTRKALRSIYSKPNRDLESLLGRAMPEWQS